MGKRRASGQAAPGPSTGACLRILFERLVSQLRQQVDGGKELGSGYQVGLGQFLGDLGQVISEGVVWADHDLRIRLLMDG
jgi:hypothetical protein